MSNNVYQSCGMIMEENDPGTSTFMDPDENSTKITGNL